MCNCLCSVIVMCEMMKGREKVKPGADIACSSRNAPMEPPGSKSPSDERIAISSRPYYMPSQHTYCGRVWNLIQAYDVQSSDQKVYSSGKKTGPTHVADFRDVFTAERPYIFLGPEPPMQLGTVFVLIQWLRCLGRSLSCKRSQVRFPLQVTFYLSK